MMNLANLRFENMEGNYIPSQPIPKEITDYYIEQRYADKMIPLNADTCRKIAKLLDKGEKR